MNGTAQRIDISIAGKPVRVPSQQIGEHSVIVTGSWLRTARLRDEELVEGTIVSDPEPFLDQLRQSSLRADAFTFPHKLTDKRAVMRYPAEWDNWAVIPLTTFADWWENRLPQESRKNARRAVKRGINVRSVPFNDDFIRGIQSIYDETPIRQGRPFWHHGKDFEAVKRINCTYLERSDFIGAFIGDELIGFIKIIYVDQTATLIQILSKVAHQDKKPTNALIAGAVEHCISKGIKSLVYGKYVYGRTNGALTEFKRRNGFEEARYLRYFVPLTLKGACAVRCHIHHGWKHIMPAPVLRTLLWSRALFYDVVSKRPASDTVASDD
jgi:hypothetical protein